MHETAPQTREDHLLLEADVTFVLAGDSNHPADASELVGGVDAEADDVEMLAEEDTAGGAVLEARVVACTELWWAIQATRPFARRKVNKRCVIKAFWLKALGERRWQVLDDAEVSVFRGTLLADPSTGEPFVLPGDDLSASWDGEQLAAVSTHSRRSCASGSTRRPRRSCATTMMHIARVSCPRTRARTTSSRQPSAHQRCRPIPARARRAARTAGREDCGT